MKLISKKLKNFFKKRKSKKIKSSGKKRKIVISGGLAWCLMFGRLKTGSAKIQNYEPATLLAPKRVILNKEFNSLKASHNSGRIIQTGTDTIFTFQQEAYHASSNQEFHLLDQDNQ